MSKLSQLKQQAYQAGKKRDWESAVSIYKNILELDKNNPTVINELGDLYLKSGDTSRAIQNFLSAAAKYRSTGLLNNAVAIYKKILRYDAENLNAHWYLAETRAGQGLIVEGQDHGVEFLEHSEKITGDIKEIFLKRCVQLVELYPESDPILDRLLQIFRMWDMALEAARVRVLLACRLWDTGEADDARQAIADTESKVPEIVNYGEYSRWLKKTGNGQEPPVPDYSDVNSLNLEAPSGETPAAEPAAAPAETAAPEAAPVQDEEPAPTPVQNDEPGANDWGDLNLGESDAAPTVPSEPEAAPSVTSPEASESVETPASAEPAAETPSPEAPSAETQNAEIPDAEKDDDGCFSIDAGDDVSFDDLLAQVTVDGGVEPPVDENDMSEEPVPTPGAGPSADAESAEPEKPVDLLAEILSADSAPARNESDQLETITQEIGAQVGGETGTESADRLYEMGLVYLEMGLFDQACSSFQQAAGDAEFAVRAHEMWGITLLRDNRPDEAIETLAEARTLTEPGTREHLGILYHLARANEQAGRTAEALQLYEQIHDQDRTYLDVGKRLSKLAVN